MFVFVCCALLCVHSGFAFVLRRKRNLVALLVLCYRCLVTTVNVLGAVCWSAVCDCGISGLY